MSAFIASAAALTLLALVLLLWPYLRRRDQAATPHRALNIAILREQLTELEKERSEGAVSEADFAQAATDLQRRLIDDAGIEDASSAPASANPPSRKTAYALSVLLPLMAAAVYLWLGNPQAMLNPGAPPHIGAPEIEGMVAKLAARLENEPDNLKGWAMLARSYKVLGRFPDAARAFERAGDFVNGDAQLLADYADTLASISHGDFAGKPTELIERALKVDPNNAMALWLAGTAAFSSQHYPQAVARWQTLLALLEPGSDDARSIQEAIADAREKGGLGSQSSGSIKPAASASISIQGEVSLAPALKNKPGPDDTLLIIAKAVGERMPLAVLRVPARLPYRYTLDDSQSLNPARKLSAAASLTVEARISKTGMAQAAAGDLLAAPVTTQPGARNVNLKVDQERP